MPYDTTQNQPPRIAVIGSGISGLSAARELSRFSRVTVFEADKRLGGHARTVLAGRNGTRAVDTGFIVFNYANYPNLARLFHDLDVPVARSDMSFGVSAEGGRLEYALYSLSAIFAQLRNTGDPRFLAMLRDIMRFGARAEAVATDEMTIEDLVQRLRLGDWFRRYYLLPMCGAIWSTPSQHIGAFPARTLVHFFRNHGLMNRRGKHQWWTVDGGSIEYVNRLGADLRSRGVDLRTGAPVTAVRRVAGKVALRPLGGDVETFDHVVFATHPDQALKILADPAAHETRALSAIRFQDNLGVLHRDTSQMPVRRKCWAAWVYRTQANGAGRGVGVTYWMNRLQNIPESDPLFVTLNPADRIDEQLIYDQHLFRHPVFDRAAIAAQGQIAASQGWGNTWFAGAWLRHGFHEDGIATALRVARAIRRQAQAGEQVAA